MWQLAQAVSGIADACRALDIPVTGGNVSLYNETDGRAIFPTTVLGVVGLIEDAKRTLARVFQSAGSAIVLLGASEKGELGASEYLKVIHGLVGGMPPELDLGRERALQALLVGTAREGLIQSAHDCSDGGFAVALAECCFESGGIGADVDVAAVTLPDGWAEYSVQAALFGESATRVIISVAEPDVDALRAHARAADVPAALIGRTGGGRLRIAVGGERVVDVGVGDAERVWSTAIERQFAGRAA